MEQEIKKILITGSSGTIGTRLFERLLEQGYEVFGFDREPNQWHRHLDELTIKGDLLKKEDLNKLPKDFDLIVHLAANARVYDSVINPDLSFENIITTHNILNFTRDNKIRNFIFSSSREVYSNKSVIISKETDVDISLCESPYGASKIADEALIYSFSKCYDINYVIFRFSNVYGMYDNSERFVPLMIRKMQKNEDVDIYGESKLLDFTYIDDCMDGIISAIKRFSQVKNNVFNIAYGKGEKLTKVAELIKNPLNSNSKILIKSSRSGEVIQYIADTLKAKKLLDYEPKYAIEKGIDSSINWYVSQPILKTSLSDNQKYPSFCELATKNDKVFKSFRKNSAYTDIVETLGYKSGKKYLKILKSQTPELVDWFDKFRKNDKYGSPDIYDYGKYGRFSPTTLRYVKILSDLKIIFGDLKNTKIIEIGGGYGGQCKIISDFFNINSYTIVDLKPALDLAKKYLDKLEVKNVNFLTLDELLNKEEKYDLVISNYAFSECEKSIQDIYFEKIIKNSQMGYIIWDFIDERTHLDIYTIKEFTKKIKNAKTIVAKPDSFSTSRILFWDNNKEFFSFSLFYLARIENAIINFFPTVYMNLAIFLKKKAPDLYAFLSLIKKRLFPI